MTKEKVFHTLRCLADAYSDVLGDETLENVAMQYGSKYNVTLDDIRELMDMKLSDILQSPPVNS